MMWKTIEILDGKILVDGKPFPGEVILRRPVVDDGIAVGADGTQWVKRRFGKPGEVNVDGVTDSLVVGSE